jgi:hypothetical protein
MEWVHTDVVEVEAKIIFKMDFQEGSWEAWTGLIIPRVGTGGGRSWMRFL